MSNNSMKNKRQESKSQTLEKIIKSTKDLIIKHGIIQLKTLDVAMEAGVAHGTLFAHFANKELLVSEVCQIELRQIAIKLKEMADQTSFELKELLENYLELVAENEDFYVVIAKEFPFLQEQIQHSIIGNETIVKNILYLKIENEIKKGYLMVEDITTLIAFFFASIQYYLSRKEYFVSNAGKLVEQKKDQIINTFLKLLK